MYALTHESLEGPVFATHTRGIRCVTALALCVVSMLLCTPVRAATLIGDSFVGHIYTGAGDVLPPTPFVAGPGPEYWESPDVCENVVFCVTTGFDVRVDTIRFTHNIEYGGIGGGTIFTKFFRLSDLDWFGDPGLIIGDVEVVSSERASLIEFGPRHVLVQVGGGSAGWSGWDLGDRWIELRLVPTLVPEPSAAVLFAIGLTAGLLWRAAGRRRRAGACADPADVGPGCRVDRTVPNLT